MYTWELEVDRARGGLIIYQRVMLNVELESAEDSTRLIEGLRRKSTESRSLFQREGERHVDRAGAQWSGEGVELGISRV